MTTHKELVIRQLSIDPEVSLKACQKVVPGLTKSNFYKIKKQWREDGGRVDTKKGSDPRSKNKSQKPPFDNVRDGGSDHLTYENDEIEFTRKAYIKGIENGNYNLLSGWVQFLDKTGKLVDFKTNREEELEETFKYMSPRDLVMESIGVQREVERNASKPLNDISPKQDSPIP